MAEIEPELHKHVLPEETTTFNVNLRNTRIEVGKFIARNLIEISTTAALDHFTTEYDPDGEEYSIVEEETTAGDDESVLRIDIPPSMSYAELSLSTSHSHADIALEGVQLARLNAETNGGDISIHRVHFEPLLPIMDETESILDLSTAEGDITVVGAKLHNAPASIFTLSGDIDLKNFSSDKNVTIQSERGGVDLRAGSTAAHWDVKLGHERSRVVALRMKSNTDASVPREFGDLA